MSFSRTLRTWRFRLFYALVQTRRLPIVTLGDRINECDWNIHPDGLNADSVVYSGGVGRDISFEHALIERFGCSIILFDPSPTGVSTMQKPENQSPRLKFRQVALAGHCGHLDLEPPMNAEEGSFHAGRAGPSSVQVPCVDLPTLMRENGHTSIDLLKIDIEGSELEVLEQIRRERLQVRQICVEFHHNNLPGFSRSQSIVAMLRMRRAGYLLLDQAGYNHTFFKPA